MASSNEGIYVSHLSGHDTKTCGKVSSPCRTISYSIQQLSTGLYIYLNGTGTLQNPYTCGKSGIHITNDVSFVSIKSRAHISCPDGKHWLVNGTKHRQGIRISFSGLAFHNAPVRVFDAFLTIDDTVFAETKHVSLDIQVVKLSRFDLSLNNVVFVKNTACLVTNSKSSEIFVNITNTVFAQNGNPSSNISSILWLNSSTKLINIQLRNCSFNKNMFKDYGMIFVENKLGTTNFKLNQLHLEENNQIKKSSKDVFDGVFNICAARISVTLKDGFIFQTSARFLSGIGQSAKINISNIEVDGFSSPLPGGGVFNLFQSDSCSLSIKDSSFRNGNNHGKGGIIFLTAPNSTLIIQNSTIFNTSSSKEGGAVYIESAPADYKSRTNVYAFVSINNSSFSYSTSGIDGAVVYIHAEKLSVIVRDSLFLRCNATSSGGALYFLSNDNTIINLHNSHFSENSADDGSIVHAENGGPECLYNFSIANVAFSKNRLHSKQPAFGVVRFQATFAKINVNVKNTHFIENFLDRGSSISITCTKSTRNFVTFDTCIFRKNVGNLGALYALGKISLTYKHLIFDSNREHDGNMRKMGKNLFLKDSVILIMNTTFVNNSCEILTAYLEGVSSLTITNSYFIRNDNIRGGANLNILPYQYQSNSPVSILITKVLFQENMAKIGVFYMNGNKVEFSNCTFLNNYAFSTGGIIMHGVGSNGLNVTKFVIRHSVFAQKITKIYFQWGIKRILTATFLKSFCPIRLTVINSTFNQATKSSVPIIMLSTPISTIFDNNSLLLCPLGDYIEQTSSSSGYYLDIKGNTTMLINYDGLTYSCKECDYNLYSLQRGTARGKTIEDDFKCLPCPRGADCVPNIKSKINYWGYKTSPKPPKLAFTICPFGYCQSPPTTNNGEYNACQGKRTGVMCGMCSQGYTEALWSTYCTPVKDCNDYWFWILFLVLVFSLAIILVFKPPLVKYCLKQILWFRRSSRTSLTQAHEEETTQEQKKQDQRQFFRFVEIIFYFYQIAQLLLSSSSLKEFFNSQFFEPALGFFNFQPRFAQEGSLCPFPGLTPETKLIFKIAPVIGTLAAIFFIYVLHSIICRTRGSFHPAIAPYFQASIKTIFLGYVTMATVSVSLIRCVFVADESRWFYNGNITCYQWWQYASFMFIAIFVIPFTLVLAVISFKLYHDKMTVTQFLLALIFPLPFLLIWLLRFVCSSTVANVEESQNLKALKEMLLAPYCQPNDAIKRGAIYWQSVLIARRFILVLIFCIITEPTIRLFCMTIVCVVVLCCHLHVKPFQNTLANNLESLSLFFLIILGLVNLFKSVFVGSEQNIKGSLITVLKIFQWLETAMLGLFPAVLLLLLSFAVISCSLRVLIVCCRSIITFFIKACGLKWKSRDSTPLLNICNNTVDGIEGYFNQH